MKKINFIIDGSNLAYRQQYGLSFDLKTSSGESSTVIYGFLKSLIKLKKEFKTAQFWVCWDGSSKKKKEIFSDYKDQREVNDLKLSVYDQINKLKDLLKTLPINQIYIPKEEADDVIASLAVNKLKTDLNYIYSNDKDFLQLVKNGERIVISSYKGKQEAYDEDEVLRKFGVSVEMLCDFRALDGDPSDNIPRCPKLRKVIIIDILNRYGSVDALYSSNFYGVSIKDYEKLKGFEKQARTNLQLIRLNKNLELDNFINEGLFNIEEFASFLDHYEITSIDINEVALLFTGKNPIFKTGVEIRSLSG